MPGDKVYVKKELSSQVAFKEMNNVLGKICTVKDTDVVCVQLEECYGETDNYHWRFNLDSIIKIEKGCIFFNG